MQAIVIGATGAVGRDLVQVLLLDQRYEKVITFTRRELGIEHRKLKSYVVDFEKPEGWQDLVKGDVLFSALGTSLKQAGSKAAQRHIDFDYQMLFARLAKEHGVPKLILVSSVGADKNSGFFYLKLKGEIEEAAAALGFDDLTILQPPSLIRKHAKRLRETVSVKAIQALNALGFLRRLAPIPTKIVAQCMANAGIEPYHGTRRITGQAIRQYVGEP